MAFRDLISGKRRGITPALERFALAGLSLLYGCGVGVRNRGFDAGIRRSRQAAVPVISVGNITTGGTGKTPFVAYLANWFREKDVAVVLLSRGYRAIEGAPSEPLSPSSSLGTSNRALEGKANDEKLLLDQLCPDVPHLQNPNRVQSAAAACRDHGARVLILDDGFQHRRLRRDLDVVLIDALNPWGYGHLLPRGLLREPISSLWRADLVVLTRIDQCSEVVKREIADRLTSIRGNSAAVEVAYPPHCLVNAVGETAELRTLTGKPAVAFCGIGNPDGFRRTLAGCDLRAFVTFPDHHRYTEEELKQLGQSASESNAAVILTTQKDLVKIHRTELDGCLLWAVQISTKVLHGNDLLEERLDAILQSLPG